MRLALSLVSQRGLWDDMDTSDNVCRDIQNNNVFDVTLTDTFLASQSVH